MFNVAITGFNGFGQLDGFATDGCDRGLSWLKKDNVKLLAATWSYLALASDQDIELWGFVGNRTQQKFILQDKPFKEAFIQIACARDRMFVVTISGDLWQLLYESMTWKNLRQAIPEACEIALDTSPEVLKVAVGETMTVALTLRGKAYRLPGELMNISDDCGPVIDVACGKEHCLLLTQKKRLFACGSSLRGQLGCGGLDSSSDPIEIDALTGMNVTSIAAGGFHSAVISEAGDLYTWGWNKQGQLGHPILGDSSPDGVLVLTEPRVVDFCIQEDVHVKNVACGASHTVVTLSDGTVWGCGWNKWKQLGLDELQRSDRMVKLDAKVPCDAKTLQVLCSHWNSVIFWKD